jgi:hypothetical protein
MSPSSRRPRSLCLFALSLLSLAPGPALAQSGTEVLRRPVGAPQRVRPNEAVAEVRTFSLARVGDRALACYVQAGLGRERGALKCASLRREADGSLSRAEPDRVIAPAASAVHVSWDSSGGLIVWVVPRPHRNETERVREARHRDGARSMQDSLNNPLGTPTLTAGDVMAVRIDHNGAPQGRPALLFAENARAFRVAAARDEQGWLVAWTGARTREGEVRGTVRAARLDGNGALVGRAMETDFSGPVGDGLRVLPRDGATAARVVWSGEHCRERPEQARYVPPAGDPSAGIERPGRFVIQQGPSHEHPGANITCDGLSLYATALRADSTLAPLSTGPALARDHVAVADNNTVVVSTRDGAESASLKLVTVDTQGRLAAGRALVASGPVLPALPSISSAPTSDDSAPTPSRVPPPQPPDRTHTLRAPVALDVAPIRGTQRAIAALSSTRARVTLARFDGSNTAQATVSASVQPIERAYEVSLLGGEVPWLFVRVGIAAGGPLVFAAFDNATDAPAEIVWNGDERLRTHLLRARAARAAVTDFDHTFGPISARRDFATNPQAPNLVNSMRRLRQRWVDACDSLQARARFLVRRGLDRDLETLARQQCEIPPEPVLPTAGAAPVTQGTAP